MTGGHIRKRSNNQTLADPTLRLLITFCRPQPRSDDLGLMDRDFDITSQELQQNLNSFGSRQKSCDDGLETLQRSFRNLHSLTDFKRTIERDHLVAVRTEELERCRFNCRNMV